MLGREADWAQIDGGLAALAAHRMRLLRPELARTLLEQGSRLRHAKQKNAAKDSLQQALAIYEQIGARLWADRARDELSRVGLRRQTQDGLTPAQARVVELACAGYTNQQIATNALHERAQRRVTSHQGLPAARRQVARPTRRRNSKPGRRHDCRLVEDLGRAPGHALTRGISSRSW
jgi:hypothetical protein